VLRACFVEKPENIDESPLGEIPLLDEHVDDLPPVVIGVEVVHGS
jgi:hypothetical protein